MYLKFSFQFKNKMYSFNAFYVIAMVTKKNITMKYTKKMRRKSKQITTKFSETKGRQ